MTAEKDWRRRARTEARWTAPLARAVIAAQERSGSSLMKFCDTEGIKYERLRRWMLRLRDDEQGGEIRLIPVQVSGSGPTAPSVHEPAPVEVRYGSLTLVIREGFAEAHLVRVLRAVSQAAPC